MKTLPLMQPGNLAEVEFKKWMSAKEVAAEFGVDEDTVLRWWHEGLPTGHDIPAEYMRRRGFRDYLFHPQILDFIRAAQASLD